MTSESFMFLWGGGMASLAIRVAGVKNLIHEITSSEHE